jgi:hypothetical protein
VGVELLYEDGPTDMNKLTVAYRKFANESKINDPLKDQDITGEGAPHGPRCLGRLRKPQAVRLTLSLLMSYIYGAPCTARIFNVVYIYIYIWTYVWQR